ncbi:F-box only protein 39-like [Planococcus citri]|uniref:F-box only protein 39-like n=1 Tax=Planococcus citri TaxID=170843 RepID=UPI0031F8A632
MAYAVLDISVFKFCNRNVTRTVCYSVCSCNVNLFRSFVYRLMNHIEPPRRLVHFDNIPDELVLEIFKWIPFDDLTSRAKLVCRRWNKIAATASLHPDILVISRQSNPKKIHHMLSKYGDNLSTIKFQDIYESRIIASLNSRHWSNLRTLSINWKHHVLDGVRISVSYLNWVIDRSPRLIAIELRECFIHGDINILMEKLQSRRISELTFMNTYLVVNGIEKLFGLRDMTKFQVCCYPLGDFSSTICTFCLNNRHSLTSLALRIDNRSTESDDLIDAITSCARLRKLHLIGRFSLSRAELLKVSQLANLKCLKIEVHRINTDEFAEFLSQPFTRQLSSLAVHWSRPVLKKELTNVIHCRNLNKLTLMFSNNFNDTEMIPRVVIQLVKGLKLKKLKIISNFVLMNFLPEICYQSEDLFCIKLIHSYEAKDLKYFRNKMNDICNFYDCKYAIYKSELEITLRKKINTQVEYVF